MLSVLIGGQHRYPYLGAPVRLRRYRTDLTLQAVVHQPRPQNGGKENLWNTMT